MDPGTLKKVITFAENIEHFLIATVSRDGLPHIAAAGQMSLNRAGFVEVAAWFCPTTVANLQDNRGISVVVWDQIKDQGYQLLGTAEKVEDIAMLNGYTPKLDENVSLPQVERKLIVRVNQILDFSQKGQSDTEK